MSKLPDLFLSHYRLLWLVMAVLGCYRLLPPRVSEVVGVCHLKAYIFDDDIMISGANLSNTYFSIRQDRYFIIRNAQLLTQHIRSLVQARHLSAPQASAIPSLHHTTRIEHYTLMRYLC